MQTQLSVTMDRHVHLPSTWRDAIGPILTDRRIAKHALNGCYGEARQKAEQARLDRVAVVKARKRFRNRWILRMEKEYQ